MHMFKLIIVNIQETRYNNRYFWPLDVDIFCEIQSIKENILPHLQMNYDIKKMGSFFWCFFFLHKKQFVLRNQGHYAS